MVPIDPLAPKSAPLPPAARWFWPLVLAAAVAGGLWRAAWLETPSFDHDEAYEVLAATTDLVELAQRHEGFPPLYRWVVGLVLAATGYGQATRWLSLAAGVATVPLAGLLGRRVAGPAAGAAAAWLLAVSANHVLLSQHGRGYGPMTLLCAAMMVAAWRLRGSDRWADWGVFLAASWLAIATHYFAGLLLVILGPLLLLEKRGPALRRGFAAAGLMAVAALPLVWCLRFDMADTGEFFHRVAIDKEAYAFGYLWLVTGNTLGPTVSELRELVGAGRTADALRAMTPWAAAVAACAGPLVWLGLRRMAPRDAAWFAVLLVAPPLMAAAAAPYAPTGYNYRYVVWMVVPLSVLAGAGAVARPAWLARSAAAGFVVLGVWATLNRHTDPRYTEHDFHAVRALIAERDAGPGPPAVLAAPTYYGAGAIYSLPADWVTCPVSAHPAEPQDWDAALPEFAAAAAPRRAGWLVLQWFPPGHPQRAVCDALAERLGAELVERVSQTVMVYRFPTENLAPRAE